MHTTNTSKIKSFNLDELRKIVKTSISRKEVLIKMNLLPMGGNYKTLNEVINYNNIDITHFVFRTDNSRFFHVTKIEDFCVNSTKSRNCIKKFIIKNKLIEYKCKKCGINDNWCNEKLSLQLDHINGINNDHRLENLRFLCPNCHSQTETFSCRNQMKNRTKKCEHCDNKIRKNMIRCQDCRHIPTKYQKASQLRDRKVVDRPDLIQLKNDVDSLGFCGTGRKYGVSDNTIRKWLR